MHKFDFVIPLRKNFIFFRTVLEGVISLYNPNNIYIITNSNTIKEISEKIILWNLDKLTNIVFMEEDIFFIKNYNLCREEIENMFFFDKIYSREFGWWFQQIIKLGAVFQISNLSDPFVIWDGDLIPIIKWNLEENNEFKFAILQESSKNNWNKDQYANSIKYLIKEEAIDPEIGTFVPHHFIFHHNVLKSMLNHIEENHKNEKNWIEIIINLSKKFYRFSEYKCVESYMNLYYNKLLKYHKFDKFGKSGKRYRDSKQIKEEISLLYKNENENDISYINFIKYTELNYNEKPSYIQIEDT